MKLKITTNDILETKEIDMFSSILNEYKTTVKVKKDEIELFIKNLLLEVAKKTISLDYDSIFEIRITSKCFNYLYFFDNNGMMCFSNVNNTETFENKIYIKEFQKEYIERFHNLGVFKITEIEDPGFEVVAHRTHYIKWELSKDISIRYFFLFQDKKEREGKYFIKSHNEKMYIEISKKEAETLIKELSSGPGKEILGVYRDNSYFKSVVYFEKEE